MSYATIVSPIEVLSADGRGRRREWSDEEKVRIVEESLQGYRRGYATARRYGLSRALLTRWRQEYRNGVLSANAPAHSFTPLAISPDEAERCAPMPLQPAPHQGPGPDMRIEIGLANGRRVTIPATLDPNILARLLPVLDAS